MITPIPPVVPAGRMADNAQPGLPLPDGRRCGWMTASHDPATSRWNLLRPQTEDEARARIGRMRERWERETAAVRSVTREDGDEGAGAPPSTGIGLAVGPPDLHAKYSGRSDILGLAAWIDVGLDRGHAEIAYRVVPASRGTGMAAEAARRLTEWALPDLSGLHRLTLCHAVANEASRPVAGKAGFRLEGAPCATPSCTRTVGTTSTSTRACGATTRTTETNQTAWTTYTTGGTNDHDHHPHTAPPLRLRRPDARRSPDPARRGDVRAGRAPAADRRAVPRVRERAA
ncbi:GNAT family N-acetyltransferase [Streptomyces canus]|uniref:GNAT family N-acetyltransferase n=1 Tax=Streptomyces canus TaxID=58343 RepID=UPI003677E1FF